MSKTHVERLCLLEPRLVSAKLGRGHHLHGLRDLRDVLGRVDSHHDLLLSGHPSHSHAAIYNETPGTARATGDRSCLLHLFLTTRRQP